MKEQNNKAIYEMSKEEVTTLKEEVKSEISVLNTEIANNTCNIVFGRVSEIEFKRGEKDTTYSDFKATKEYESFLKEGVENYSVLCSEIWKDGKLNNDVVKDYLKYLKVPKNFWWKVLWKDIKKGYLETKKMKQIENRLKKLKEEEEKEKKVGEK